MLSGEAGLPLYWTYGTSGGLEEALLCAGNTLLFESSTHRLADV